MAAPNSAASSRQLSQKEADIRMMLSAEVHLGTKNCDFQMERYVFKRRNDGIVSDSLFFLPFGVCLNMIKGMHENDCKVSIFDLPF